MSSVYLATDLRLEREVAVKVLLANLARDPDVAERFEREARRLAAVAHPSIAEIFDVEQGDPATGREPFYVMELCEGGSLAARIDASGPLEPGELVPIILVISAALGELHSRGLLHRDVKPANILFTGGRPKLADFGLARPGGAAFETLTQPGTAMGTPAYMAPELVVGGRATTASDVYALAATTFHGLTGRAPRPASSLTGLADRLSEDAPLISSVSPRLGTAYDAALAAALSTDPIARPALGAYTASLVAALGLSIEVAVPPLVDPTSDTTVIAAPEPPTRIAHVVAVPAPRGSREGPLATVLPIALLVMALLAIPAAIALWPGGAPLPSSSASGVPSAPVSPSPAATIAPSPSILPTPEPTVDPSQALTRALAEVDAAIDQAKGGPDGLKGGDARKLEERTDKIRSLISDSDLAEARKEAERLLDEAQKIAKELDDQRAANLVQAVEHLLATLPD